MQPRKIIIVIENMAGKGGTERVASGLANALARLPGYEVAVFSLFGERSFFPLASDVRLRCGGGDSLFWPWRLAFALRRERADVIITVSMGKLSVVMTPFLRLFCARSRLLLSEHVSFHQYPRVFKWLKLLVYRLSDRVIFLTRQDSDAIARWVGAGKCRVIENVSPFRAQAPTPALQQKVALAVGRLSNQKGFDRLIALWRGVAAQVPDWRLLIIGDGPERDALLRQIEDAGLARQVSLLPVTADVADYYRQASLYVMTSRYEGLPMVLIEAMSFGLPLVAYDCKTGPAELIDDGVNGYLVPDDDAAAFSEGVIKLMLDPGLREHFSVAALEKSRRFSPERIYPQWQQLTE
ncbi:TPA: glycosyltransferase family 4 protein [Serratia marcescens]|uniref:glycosyltransferase family 4 protein n=1 Tax=Serratia marcescens TaxID=615 RepID=UPI0013DC2D05|nr:glycosyltransferase family 4 protein [Serratia marcescens]MBH2833985.1 glycosyltransferase family 4 protein [Serratia marcescens]MDU7468078.1 glycosyltransferase family 4 protein [Serratia marcescens]HEJ7091198.1 glycosyltransferase family 4 protein [Serratia marcescens]